LSDTNQPVTFGVNDLRTILQIIQTVSSRGAIKAEEMSVVGDIYSRISAFVAQAEQAARLAEAANKPEEQGEK